MAGRKRNEWLDAGDSEEADQYDSEAVEESRRSLLTKSGRANKRRKISSMSEDASDLDSVGEDNHSGLSVGDGEDAGDGITTQALEAQPMPKLLSSKSVEKSQRLAKKSGVLYLSRVPPFMKPQTVKHLLSRFGPIGRIFLTPESSEKHTARVKSGGNKKKSFTDGWVEFLSKRDAKLCAETLNTQIIGGKKGGWYYDDVWNMKYLKGFKWHHLTDQIANENAERAARMRAEIAQTTRENKAFLANVEKAKMLENMKAKRKRREEGGESQTSGGAAGSEETRHFKQKEVRRKGNKPIHRPEQPDEVKRVLSKIF